MYFLDELDDWKLYRRRVILPLDEKDKRHNSMAFILSPNLEGTKSVFNNPLLVARYYNSYYMERAILYYVNQENSIEEFNDEYITEAKLYDDSDMKISWEGYSHYIQEAKGNLKPDWFESQCNKLKIRKSKISSVHIKVSEKRYDSTKNIINLVPFNRYPKDFKSYANYCHFSALMWMVYQENPTINSWLCMAIALKESGVSGLYSKKDWPFNFNLGVVCRSLDLYEKENGRQAYISDIIKGYKGEKKLNITIGDILSLLGKDLRKELESANKQLKSFLEKFQQLNLDRVDRMWLRKQIQRFSKWIKEKLSSIRLKIVLSLKGMMKPIKEALALIEPILKPPSLDTIITWANNIIKVWMKPYEKIVTFAVCNAPAVTAGKI